VRGTQIRRVLRRAPPADAASGGRKADQAGKTGTRRVPTPGQGGHSQQERRRRMRECRSCGRVNPDDVAFCECGEYLRWEPTGYLPAVSAPTTADGPASSDAADQATDAAQPSP